MTYFLEPSQPHGFDADLLKAFLDKAGQVTGDEIEYYHRDIEHVSVETEVRSPQNNQPDILIRAPDEWFVCIESKVDSSEGDRQTERYVKDTHIGNELKDEHPEDGRYYLFPPHRRGDNAIKFKNRPETDTPLKNASNGQRDVNISDGLKTVLNDYINNPRYDELMSTVGTPCLPFRVVAYTASVHTEV